MEKKQFEEELSKGDLNISELFQDEFFDDKTKKWKAMHDYKWMKLGKSSAEARSRYIIHENSIFCETEGRNFQGSTKDVFDLIYNVEWTWWKHSKFDNVKREAGKFEYDFYPTGKMVVVHQTMFKPFEFNEDKKKGYRIPLFFEGEAKGIAHFDVLDDERGSVRVIGRFVNMSTTFSWFLGGVEGFAKNHLNAELGKLDTAYLGFGSLMFPKETGWVGLGELLESKVKKSEEKEEGEEEVEGED